MQFQTKKEKKYLYCASLCFNRTLFYLMIHRHRNCILGLFWCQNAGAERTINTHIIWVIVTFLFFFHISTSDKKLMLLIQLSLKNPNNHKIAILVDQNYKMYVLKTQTKITNLSLPSSLKHVWIQQNIIQAFGTDTSDIRTHKTAAAIFCCTSSHSHINWYHFAICIFCNFHQINHRLPG